MKVSTQKVAIPTVLLEGADDGGDVMFNIYNLAILSYDSCFSFAWWLEVWHWRWWPERSTAAKESDKGDGTKDLTQGIL